jgi:Tfp pilus assembly protein PilO
MKKSLPFILIALAIATFVFFTDAQYGEVQELEKQKEENLTMLGLAQELRAKRKVLEDAYDEISAEDRRELEKLLPDTVDNVRLILAIDDVASQYGIGNDGNDNNSSAVSSVDTSGSIGTIRLSFSVESTYKNFLSFMNDLESSLRLVDIKSLKVTQRNDEDVFLRFEVTLNTYWLR